MDDKASNKDQILIFESRPIGEPVNPHVIQIAPQHGLDYARIQRSIVESAKLISMKKPED